MRNLGQVRKPKFTSRLARPLGLCLLAVLATAAVTATSASASLPEWGGCEPVAGGKYHDSGCVQPLTAGARKTQGHYEWYTGEKFGTVFNAAKGKGPKQLDNYTFGETSTVAQIGPSTFETSAGKKMTCAESAIFFALENANTKGVKHVYLNLKGCESEGHPCESNFFEEGEITNQESWFEEEGLKGTLGYISGKGTTSPEVGLLLTAFRTPKQWKEKLEAERAAKGEPPLKKGEYQTAESLLFGTCKATGPESVGNLKIGGESKGGNYIIAHIDPVDQMATEHQVTYIQTAGIQSPAAFEGKKTTGLLGFTESTWQPLGWETPPFTVRPEERFEPEKWLKVPPIEIKATP